MILFLITSRGFSLAFVKNRNLTYKKIKNVSNPKVWFWMFQTVSEFASATVKNSSLLEGFYLRDIKPKRIYSVKK